MCPIATRNEEPCDAFLEANGAYETIQVSYADTHPLLYTLILTTIDGHFERLLEHCEFFYG